MYNISANNIVGRKIFETRSMLNISQETLSDRINDACGIHISSHMIGRYERGERTIDEDTLVAIAIGLETSLQNLQDGIDPRNGEPPAAPRRINKLGQFEHKIYTDIAANWHGDSKALAIANACYCMLPDEYRIKAIMGIMEQVAIAISSGDINPEKLPDGLPYLQDKIGALSKKAGGTK